MQAVQDNRTHSPLRQLVAEASLALARLDPKRLEELADSCRALNRDLIGLTDAELGNFNQQAREAFRDMAVFGRVLDATRANLEVMDRLRNRGGGTREYTVLLSSASAVPWAMVETNHGHN